MSVLKIIKSVLNERKGLLLTSGLLYLITTVAGFFMNIKIDFDSGRDMPFIPTICMFLLLILLSVFPFIFLVDMVKRFFINKYQLLTVKTWQFCLGNILGTFFQILFIFIGTTIASIFLCLSWKKFLLLLEIFNKHFNEILLINFSLFCLHLVFIFAIAGIIEQMLEKLFTKKFRSILICGVTFIVLSVLNIFKNFIQDLDIFRLNFFESICFLLISVILFIVYILVLIFLMDRKVETNVDSVI
ncbi:MAG: hypothetical protein LBT69_05715 [Lactobacillales bacterium]|jgi:hypothetical protein|nr:hypothetical protein [Lactobacillales bacterium]